MTEKKGWWERNWYWMLAVGCLTPILACGGCLGFFALFVKDKIENFGPYNDAVAIAVAHPVIVEELGEPIEAGFALQSNVQINNGEGSANLNIPLSGPRGSAHLRVVAIKSGGDWTFTKLKAHVDGLANLLGALEARRRPPRRVLFTSSTSVFHQRDGSWVDETSPTEPSHHRGRVMLEAEARLARSRLCGVGLRLGGIYGPGRTRLVDSVRAGRATWDPRGAQYTNRIHRDDAAAALAHLARLAEPAPLYLGVDDEPAAREAVLRWLAGRLGAPEPRAEPGAGALDAGKRCRNERLRKSGWAPGYPSYREGYAAMLEAAGPGD